MPESISSNQYHALKNTIIDWMMANCYSRHERPAWEQPCTSCYETVQLLLAQYEEMIIEDFNQYLI